MTNRKITPATAGFGATRVGDGVLFGVDAERPIHLVDGTNVFDEYRAGPFQVSHRTQSIRRPWTTG